jgi:putative endopeptidase
VSGQKEDVPLWKRAVNVVKNTLPDAVGRMYVQRYFPEDQKQRVTAMVERMRQAFASASPAKTG